MRETIGEKARRKLNEPSTWVGVAQALMAVGMAVDPRISAIVSAGMGVWGAVNVVRREQIRTPR